MVRINLVDCPIGGVVLADQLESGEIDNLSKVGKIDLNNIKFVIHANLGLNIGPFKNGGLESFCKSVANRIEEARNGKGSIYLEDVDAF